MRKVVGDASIARAPVLRIDQGLRRRPPPARLEAFVGRDPELAVLTAAWERADCGDAQVVRIEGEPGMGKSALLESFLERRSRGTELWMRCDVFEADLAYATVGLLIEQPDPATSEVETGRRLVRRLRDRTAASGVTVVAIDDAQWMDGPSSRALRFALRRLRGHRVLALLARRPLAATADNAEGPADAAAGLGPIVRLAPLDAAAVRLMARRLRSWELLPDLAERLVRRTGGVPLLLAAILRGAEHQSQLESGAEVPATVAAAARRLLASVPPAARRLVEASAVLAVSSDLVVLGELGRVADPFAAAGAAEAAGLLTIEPSGAVDCGHDLVREAVYRALEPSRRRELHARAGRWTVGDRSLAHRAAAAERPDPGLVGELTTAAESARASLQYDLAAAHLLRARAVSGNPEDRNQFLLEALLNRVTALNLSAAVQLAEIAQGLPPSALRSLALGLLARESGRAAEARTLLHDALVRARAEEDQPLLARAALANAVLHVQYNDGPSALEVIDVVEGAADLNLAGEARVTRGLALWLSGDSAAARALLDATPLSAYGATWESELSAVRGMIRRFDGQLSAALSDFDRAVDLVHLWRPSTNGCRIYVMRSMARFDVGDWDGAAVDAAEARALAEEVAPVWSIPYASAVSVQVPANRGQWHVAAAHLAAAKRGLSRLSPAVMIDFVALRETALLMARRDYPAVVALLEPLRSEEAMAPIAIVRPHRWVLPNWIIACLELGRLDDAERALRDYEVLLDRWPGGQLPSRLNWLRGRVAEGRGDAFLARAHYADELSDPALAELPFLHAEVRYSAGRLERALGNRRAAIEHLELAQSIFAALRASPHLERCETELTSCGVRSNATSHRGLTAREQDVAALVVRGHTNKEVAAELFLTEKGVQYHLSNIFAKLGVRNRRELRRAGGL